VCSNEIKVATLYNLFRQTRIKDETPGVIIVAKGQRLIEGIGIAVQKEVLSRNGNSGRCRSGKESKKSLCEHGRKVVDIE
jgi:hypothetical protein